MEKRWMQGDTKERKEKRGKSLDAGGFVSLERAPGGVA